MPRLIGILQLFAAVDSRGREEGFYYSAKPYWRTSNSTRYRRLNHTTIRGLLIDKACKAAKEFSDHRAGRQYLEDANSLSMNDIADTPNGRAPPPPGFRKSAGFDYDLPNPFPAHVYECVGNSALAMWDELVPFTRRLPPGWEVRFWEGDWGEWDIVLEVMSGPYKDDIIPVDFQANCYGYAESDRGQAAYLRDVLRGKREAVGHGIGGIRALARCHVSFDYTHVLLISMQQWVSLGGGALDTGRGNSVRTTIELHKKCRLVAPASAEKHFPSKQKSIIEYNLEDIIQ